MIAWPELLRWLHVIGATVLLGTGAGIAFFMLIANRTRDPTLIAHVARTVVVADFVFTATAVIAQPITGALLAHQLGWSLLTPWIALSLAVYVLTGLCWLPVVAIQIKMCNLARTASERGVPLDQRYHRLFRSWVMLGIPAFFSVLGILWLMVARPDL